MTLQDLGYNQTFEEYRQQHNLGTFDAGRVSRVHKDRYTVNTGEEELECELLGNLRYTVADRSALPAVGDWVAISKYDEGKALIHAVFPRFSVLERQAVGRSGERQIIASNLDYGIIVQSVNRDFNLNRLERYISLCNSGGVEPIVVISKTDLSEQQDLDILISQVKARVGKVPVLAVSNTTLAGIPDLKKLIAKGKTYCLLGSSGVGKSSLINSLSGESLMKTGEISENIDRGKHVTTHRELIPMINGAILIDNPGMREVGMTDAGGGLESTFEEIHKLTLQCKFSDCTHTSEKGCAVREAIEKGDIDELAFENYLKLLREKEHYESTVAEKRRKDKDQGKLFKRIKKSRKSNKF